MLKQIREAKLTLGIIMFLLICLPVCMPTAAQSLDVSSGDVSSGNATVVNEVVEVLLPTEFTVLLYKEPGEDVMKLESQDILLINKSGFPVNVKVKDIKCTIKENTEETGEDNCLFLRVKEFQKDEYVVPYERGNFIPFYIGLDETGTETDEQQLMKEAEGWNPVGAVESADYSILRLEGKIGNDKLREEDIEVGIVFEFEAAQEGKE